MVLAVRALLDYCSNVELIQHSEFRPVIEPKINRSTLAIWKIQQLQYVPLSPWEPATLAALGLVAAPQACLALYNEVMDSAPTQLHQHMLEYSLGYET